MPLHFVRSAAELNLSTRSVMRSAASPRVSSSSMVAPARECWSRPKTPVGLARAPRVRHGEELASLRAAKAAEPGDAGLALGVVRPGRQPPARTDAPPSGSGRRTRHDGGAKPARPHGRRDALAVCGDNANATDSVPRAPTWLCLQSSPGSGWTRSPALATEEVAEKHRTDALRTAGSASRCLHVPHRLGRVATWQRLPEPAARLADCVLLD